MGLQIAVVPHPKRCAGGQVDPFLPPFQPTPPPPILRHSDGARARRAGGGGYGSGGVPLAGGLRRPAALHCSACRWPVHWHLHVPLVTQRDLWSCRPVTSFFLRFCADRLLCPRATAQHCFGGYKPQEWPGCVPPKCFGHLQTSIALQPPSLASTSPCFSSGASASCKPLPPL